MCTLQPVVKATQQIPVSLPLPGTLQDELIVEENEFAIAHGMVLRRAGVLGAVPFAMLPSPMPRALFLVRIVVV